MCQIQNQRRGCRSLGEVLLYSSCPRGKIRWQSFYHQGTSWSCTSITHQLDNYWVWTKFRQYLSCFPDLQLGHTNVKSIRFIKVASSQLGSSKRKLQTHQVCSETLKNVLGIAFGVVLLGRQHKAVCLGDNSGDTPCVAVARYQTFHRVYMARWQDVLKFRSKNLFPGIEAVKCFLSNFTQLPVPEEAANGLLKTASPILTKVKLGVMQSVTNQLISHVAGLAPKVRQTP